MFKRVICFLFCIVFAFTALSGCHKSQPEPEKTVGRTLTIAYYDGKYGNEWITSIVKAYKIKNPDIKINLRPDSALDKKAGNILESDKNVPDIMFLSRTNWQHWAEKGYIADLTGLFNTVVDNDTTLSKKIQPDFLNYCKYKNKYWIVPWDDGVTGFAYNVMMFEQNNWKVPVTMADLYALLPQIKEKGIVPIAWAGKNIGDWGYAVNNWWAQSEGKSGMSAYLKLDSPQAYLQQGRVNALAEFLALTGDKTNSAENVIAADAAKAQKDFFGSKAAMILCASWIECKAKASIPSDFKMGMMRAPAVNEAKDANINIAAAGSFAVVPSVSKNTGLAQDFLRFMSTDKMLELYTRITSTPRPFVYHTAQVEGMTDFGKSVINIWNAGDNIYQFSENPLYYNVFSDWPKDGAPYMQIFSNLLTPQMAVEENYQYVKENWERAKKSIS